MAPLVFFIGAASSGFGKGIAVEALIRGHRVIATARNASKIADLKEKGAVTMNLDVTHPLDQIKATVAEAQQVYGRIDVLVNAAGYILEGAIEEASPKETFDSFNTNVFGVLNLTRAVLPYMREQRSGVIAQFGSVGSWRGFAGGGLYVATKWAISGLTESLRLEVEPFGIDVVCIEPGYFRTGFLNPGARFFTEHRIKDYDDTTVGQVRAMLNSADNQQPGDPELGCKVCVDVLTKKDEKAIPVRLVLGSDASESIRQKCEETIELLREWEDVSRSTDFAKH